MYFIAYVHFVGVLTL